MSATRPDRLALRFALWLVLASGLFAAPLPRAAAHDGGATAFARITISGQTVRYSLSIPDAASRSSAAAPRDAGSEIGAHDALAAALRQRVRLSGDTTACAPGAARVGPALANSIGVTVTIDFACPPSMRVLTIRDDSFEVLGSDLHILARIERDGASEQFAFATENREARITLDAAPVPARGIGSFFVLGIEHILTGYDHLLFLLALLIGGSGVWSLVKVVTAFTLAHSVTLTAASLDWIVLPSRLVESAIALSIAYVALENILLRERGHSKRWLVALVFGLVHGFGFSAVLKELGLPTDGLVWSLLLFNLGVEAGQTIAIVVAAPLLIGLQRVSWRTQTVRATSLAILATGAVLFVERAFFS
jgi:hydrogenase/urease accessory protein HupE